MNEAGKKSEILNEKDSIKVTKSLFNLYDYEEAELYFGIILERTESSELIITPQYCLIDS